jgi:hypothetical protein
MILAWTKDLKTEEDKERFLKSLRSSKKVLERMKELLEEEKNSLESAEISHKIYDSPNWEYRQAHTNGFKAALRMITKLITLDQEEINGRQPTPGRPVRTPATTG